MNSENPELVTDIEKTKQKQKRSLGAQLVIQYLGFARVCNEEQSFRYTEGNMASDIRKAMQALDCWVTGSFPKP